MGIAVIIACCIGSFLLGVGFFYILIKALIAKSNRSSNQEEHKKTGTMDVILIVIGITTLVFTVAMIWIFIVYGAIPDTLCNCFFAFVGGECGIMGWIQNAKKKYKKSDDTDEEAKG